MMWDFIIDNILELLILISTIIFGIRWILIRHHSKKLLELFYDSSKCISEILPKLLMTILNTMVELGVTKEDLSDSESLYKTNKKVEKVLNEIFS